MQFNITFLATALLVSASPVLSVVITFFQGSGCTGGIIAQSTDLPAFDCLSLVGVTAKSIGYSGVPNQISFYKSGGAHDTCSNGAQLVFSGGSGCSTAPDGVNWESMSYN